MSNKNNDIFNENLKELHEEAGLQFAGRDEEGEPQYIGTDEQWKKYNNLTK